MKINVKKIISAVLVAAAIISLTSCDLLGGITSSKKEPDYSDLSETVAFKTENFEIDGAALRVFFYNNYQKLSARAADLSLNTSKPLQDQSVIKTEAGLKIITQIFGENAKTDGTYFDLLWDETQKEVKTLLAICEAARADGVELSSDEIAKIDSKINEATQNNKNYFADTYGKGIKSEDVRASLIIIALGEKYIDVKTERIFGEITDELVEEFFRNNEKEYTTENMYDKIRSFAHIVVSEYADDESKPAKAEAERILAEFLAGEKTEARFNDLMNSKKTFADKLTSKMYAVGSGNAGNITGDYSFSYVTGAVGSGSVSFETMVIGSGSLVGGFSGASGSISITVGGAATSDVGTSISDTDGIYDDVRPGKTVSQLDKWIFDDSRVVGDTEIIVVSSQFISKNDEKDSTQIQLVAGCDYHIVWYLGEGDEIWFVDSKNDLCDKLVSEWKEQLNTSATVTDVGSSAVKDKIAK